MRIEACLYIDVTSIFEQDIDASRKLFIDGNVEWSAASAIGTIDHSPFFYESLHHLRLIPIEKTKKQANKSTKMNSNIQFDR